MTQQEIWDDSALVQAFNKAINSYKEGHDPKKRAEAAAKETKNNKKIEHEEKEEYSEDDDQYYDEDEQEYEEDVKYQSKQQQAQTKQVESTSKTRSRKQKEPQQDNTTDEYTKQWQEYYAQMNNYNNANSQYYNPTQFPPNPNPSFNAPSSFPPSNPYPPPYYPNQWGGYGPTGPMPGAVPPVGPHQWQMPMIAPPPPPPQFTNDGTIEYVEKKNDSNGPKIRINFNNEGKSVVVPVSPFVTVSELVDLIKAKFERLHGAKVQGDKLFNEKGSLLDGEDLVGDVLANDQLVRFEKKQVKNTTSSSKTLTNAAAASKAEAQSSESKKDEPKKAEAPATFTTEIKEMKDETGEIVDTQLFVVFKDAKLIEAVRAFISTDKLYDKEPRLNAETLLQYMPQFEKSTSPPIQPLLKFLREEFGDLTAKVNAMIADGKVSYSLLWAVFSPEVHIASSLRSHHMAAKVTRSKYNHSSWFPSFEVDAITIKCNGQHFYRDTIRYSIEAFNGLKKFDELPIQPLSAELKEKLIARGKVFRKYGKGAHYLMYTGFIERKSWWSTTLIKADGRVMVDGSSFQRLNPNYGVFSNSPSNDAILPQIPDDILHLTYPTLGGFSFTAKKWGEIDLNKLEEIVYDDDAFDRLVLPNEKKKLIRSLVENTQTSFSDIISGKGGGCIFLLHGSPGVGKTLTAEAIAELLHRPLYSVSVGELGTNTDELEKKLREILELASTWNAVILIDEADIFLERRSENDIVRNAMVGIFLRLLEYHQGVLFLTTNRVRCFDEAFHSRISVALKYEDLDREAREKIWTNLLNAAKITGLDAKSLSEFVINGRQIRTTIRLAQSLANSEGATVTKDHVMATITVAQQFVSDLMNENAPQTN